MKLIVIVCLMIATNAHAGWIYLVPDYNYFGFRDRNGVLHAWQGDQARYNNVPRDYQVQINGHWLSVGRDIYQLTDVPIPINLEHGREKRSWRFT
jgi:hypothetical protein